MGRCNFDTLSPKRSRNTIVKSQWTADEAVVVVKLVAEENMVTYLRVKLPERDMDVGGEGWNMGSSTDHSNLELEL
ncbi:hypothetical protein BVX93_00910 [bacterium B13(2017)]|nr:hypothetical protein BVX93_00910 [bacterium B13(2017)]